MTYVSPSPKATLRVALAQLESEIGNVEANLAKAQDYIRRIDEMGGMVRALEAGYPQGEIADAAYEQARELEAHERDIVGVTKYADPNEELWGIIQSRTR